MERNDMRPFLSPKHFRTSFEVAGCRYEVELETPDLNGCSRSVWGDWGPMYTFELGWAGRVCVTYRCEERSLESIYQLRLSEIQLLSPMRWLRRRRNPFYLEVEDGPRGLGFAGFLDKSGEPDRLEVKVLRPEPEVAVALFPFAEDADAQHVAAYEADRYAPIRTVTDPRDLYLA